MKNKHIFIYTFLLVFTLFLNGCSSSNVSASVTPPSNVEVSENADKLKVNFLDVGQGDSIFIELPKGKTMLIDAGESENSKIITDYIKNLGYQQLDYVVATHPHSDHIGAMEDVIKNFEVKNIYMPKVQHTTKTFENLLTEIKSKGLKVTTAKSGINILTDGILKIDVVAPVGTEYDDLNNYSAVIKITYGNNSFLLTGDAEILSENEITADIKSDVLKVGHHGSDSSTGDKFLNLVNPKYAVISVGKENKYNHPTQVVLDRLNKSNIEIYRTDELGTIVFTSDGNTISINKNVEQKPVVTQNNNVINVYVTKSGKKYHKADCSSLSKGKIEMLLETAKSEGYTPCSKCNPAQ